jgi:serine/threonine-protein kinase
MEAAARDIPEQFTVTADVVPDARGDRDDDLPIPLGEQVGPYVTLDVLGKGGMGVVYLAKHVTVGQRVALKMIRIGGQHRSDLLYRFRTEAKAIARLEHPNIVRLYGYDEHKGLPYHALELVEGMSLAKKLMDGVLEFRAAAELVQTLACALGYAHGQGVVHRDLKPSNVLLTTAGKSNLIPKVADFGLAKLMDVEGPGCTSTNGILGTPSYMAPEQAEGRPDDIDLRTDVYALGAILYELLTGQPPYLGKNKIETIRLVVEREIVAPSHRRRGLSADLEAVCLKCLEADAAKRYQSAEELADDLGRWLDRKPTRARPLRWSGRVKLWVRRQARAIAVGLFVLGMAGGSVALYLSAPTHQTVTQPDTYPLPNADPREWRALAAELSSGKPVSLTYDNGRPRWSRWHNPTGLSKVTVTADGECSISAPTVGLLELLWATPTDRYRFTAQLRHDRDTSSASMGRIGVFVGRVIHPGEQKDVQFFVELSWNAISPRIGRPAAEATPDEPMSSPELRPCLLIDKGTTLDLACEFPGVLGPAFKPLGPDNGAWFDVIVDVTEEGVHATVKQHGVTPSPTEQVMHATRDDIVRWATEKLKDPHGPHAHNPDIQNLQLKFEQRLGLGIVTRYGSGAFKNVRIEPLPSNR